MTTTTSTPGLTVTPVPPGEPLTDPDVTPVPEPGPIPTPDAPRPDETPQPAPV